MGECLPRMYRAVVAKDKPSESKSQADGWACDSVDRALACPGMYETLGYIPSVTSWGWSVPAPKKQRQKDQKVEAILGYLGDPG